MELEQRVIDRFWSKVDKTGECWLWLKAKTSDGYGAWSWYEGKRQHWYRAHQFAYRITKGIPKKPELHHVCENKICVRPDHLMEATRKEHMRLTPGSYGYKWAQRTHCEKGHELKGDNLVAFALKRGFRKCRTCSIEKAREWRRANPEKMRAAVRNWTKKNHQRKLEYDRARHRRKTTSEQLGLIPLE